MQRQIALGQCTYERDAPEFNLRFPWVRFKTRMFITQTTLLGISTRVCLKITEVGQQGKPKRSSAAYCICVAPLCLGGHSPSSHMASAHAPLFLDRPSVSFIEIETLFNTLIRYVLPVIRIHHHYYLSFSSFSSFAYNVNATVTNLLYSSFSSTQCC